MVQLLNRAGASQACSKRPSLPYPQRHLYVGEYNSNHLERVHNGIAQVEVHGAKSNEQPVGN